jgi:AraC-like DNA-binding protein
MSIVPATYFLLAYPYTRLQPITPSPGTLRERGRAPGSARIWSMGERRREPGQLAVLRQRPGGLPLIVVLPPHEDLASRPELGIELQHLRPQGLLPFHSDLEPADLAQVLRRPPIDLSADVTDYLRWRGLGIDRDTARLIRRILDLSGELRSISSVSRSMYLSRRALGRRLLLQGLPVPSHWLQVGRLLRVAVRLQNSDATVSSVAFEHGYPDGFSLSNQMERLIGHRPSEVRRRLGWEWLVEAWLRREAGAGRLGIAAFRSTDGPPDPGSTRILRPDAAVTEPERRRVAGG